MKKSLLLGTAISVTLGGITGAVAQSEDTIVVTATKREQTLQEVPVAVSVVDDSVIEQAQINDILDLQSIVPSLRVSQLEQSGNTSFIIRGFGNGSNNPGIEPSVGVFVDGVYRSRSAGAISDLPELQRVEVLRGPQSTLFGKNASAGVVSFITQAPQFETQGSVEATYGNYNQAIVKGYVTGPLSETVAYSLSGSLNQRDGYVDNNFLGTEINDRDRWALRGQLLFEPSSDLSFRFIADYDEINEKCCYAPHLFAGPFTQATQLLGGQFNDDPFTYETFLDRDPTNEITNGGISLTVEQNFENMDLTVITSYRDQSLLANGDTDFTSANIISGREVNNDVQTFTGEIRLASNGNSRFEWMVGGFLFDEQLQGDGNVFYGPQFSNYADILVEGAGLPGALGA
ncbi:MAG: TonB-dependent receptor plug domain-containing protein, partial [Pseudomonadota bacterium]